MLEVTCFVNKFFMRSLEKANLKRGFNWINLEAPTDKELGKLAKKIRIPISKLKDFMDPEERPRVEEIRNWTLIIFKTPESEKSTSISSIGILLSENTIITFSKTSIDAIRYIQELPTNRKIKFFNKGTDYFVFRLLDEFFSDYFKVIDYVEDKSEKIEHRIIKKPEKDVIDNLIKIKKIIIHLHRALLANREVIAGIEKGYSKHITKPVLKYFRELYNDCVQLIELEETQREIFVYLTDIHLSVTSTNLNKIVKTLTIIAAFIWIPALIAGIYGMNFFASGQQYSMPEIYWIYGYPFALALMVISVIIVALIFKKKGWL
ncbi:magnesium/cobalt transporter CorA [Candidatus Woesearchaeota archaeon]|nr:magnesium/cobalt transporter CorA [Candidatus Woesearchaeota archaeon]